VTYSGPERRDLRGRAAVSARLTAALSNPSILLTVDEAGKLLGVQPDASERILRRLEASGVLQELRRGEYVPGPLISGIRRT
jgi:predicted transcriptional regulator of viral defense system